MKKIVFLLILNIFNYFNEDPYNVLNIKDTADDKEIENAYEKLKKKYENENSYYYNSDLERIKKAYDIISNRAKRHVYDIRGMNGVREYEYGLKTGQHQYRTGNDLEFTLSLTLEELYLGTQKNISFGRISVCNHCKGKGAEKGKLEVCSQCHGQGQIIRQVRTDMGYMQFQETCPKCGGKGEMIKERCPICGGHKVVHQNKSLDVKIEKGTKNNDVIVFEAESNSRPEFLPGDVLVKIIEKDHQNFKRSGNDLIYDLKINLKEAIKGFEKKIKHLDNRWITVKKETISNHNNFIKLNGEGMPIKDQNNVFGDLFLKINIELPRYLSPKASEYIKNIFK